MRKFFVLYLTVFFTWCLVCAVNMTATTQTNKQSAILQENIARQVIRFHVRANSDEADDQAIKMQVKSAVLTYLYSQLDTADHVHLAASIIERSIGEIKQIAKTVQSRSGDWDREVRVALKNEYFPEKTYGDCTFPAGEYQALVIELGKGEGHNWWCMIYPGLCFVDECYAVVPEKEKEKLKEELPQDAYEWITKTEKRKCTFFWNGWKEIVGCDKIGISF